MVGFAFFCNSGAGAVKPPVLDKFVTGLIIPALPICKMLELATEVILIMLM